MLLDILSYWWRNQLDSLEIKQPKQLLTDSFACFSVALSLLFFYLQLSIDVQFLYFTFSLSIFFAFFLTIVVCLAKHCPNFYKISMWFDDRIIIPWVLILTPTLAFLRLFFIYFNTPEKNSINYLFIPLALYYIVYIIVFLFTGIRRTTRQTKPKAIDTLRMMSMSGLLFLCIIIIINTLSFSTTNTDIFSYIAVLVITGIPLIKAVSMQIKEQRKLSSTLLFTSLIIITFTAILFVVGIILHADVSWLWFCFAMILTSLILLCIVSYLDRIFCYQTRFRFKK